MPGIARSTYGVDPTGENAAIISVSSLVPAESLFSERLILYA